jgi:hypothetical protein
MRSAGFKQEGVVSAGPPALCLYCNQTADRCGNCARLLLDGVPVLSSTILGLEMLLDPVRIDIGAATACVLSDVGASIQILARTSKEYDAGAGLPGRIAECIAGLDLRDFLSDLCGRTMACRTEYAPVIAVWDRCRQVAQYAYIMAESIGGISPDDAYLAGLLDDRGAIAGVLGWPRRGRKGSSTGNLMAHEHLLPASLLPAFESTRTPDALAWSFLLSAAHSLADGSVCANVDAIQ